MKLKETKFKTVKVRGGKDYVEVKDRVKYLSQDFDGDYSIQTEYQYFESRKMWVVKATVTLVQGGVSCVYTGMAQEIESVKTTEVNFTSALENAETSAVGRACAFAGIGIETSIASADEVNKAITRREMDNVIVDAVPENKPAKPIAAEPAKPVQSAKMAPTPADAILTESDDLKSLIDTANQLKSVDDWHRFADKFRAWEGVEGFDLAMTEAYARVKALPLPITNEQKTQILLLLNNSVITKEEKDKMVAKLSGLDKERAEQAITKLKKVIKERTTDSSASNSMAA